LQARSESGKLIGRTLRQNFDTAVMIIPHPSRNAQDVRLALHKPAEANPLHAPADDETAGLNCNRICVHWADIHYAQRIDPMAKAAWIKFCEVEAVCESLAQGRRFEE
jgi:hypothetical protein